MLKMSQVNYIRDLSNSGYRIAEISKKLKLDRKTVRKYLNQEDFSPTPPVKHPVPSKLDPYKPKILEWLAEDQHVWQKQHTAKRILDRLREEEGFDGSYSIVQRYVKSVRHAQQARATQELVWEPGSTQVDFGEADFNVNGVCRRMKYLTVSFPYSNDGFTQVFGGETAECVCQGLRNIFEYIGGVPALPRALRMPREVLQSICGLRKGQCRAQGRLCPRQALRPPQQGLLLPTMTKHS